MRVLVLFAIVTIAVTTPLLAQTAAPADSGSEREQLRRSLATACTQYSREDQWDAADRCRRAWFSAHEEAVWRLGLNPHGAPAQQPPS